MNLYKVGDSVNWDGFAGDNTCAQVVTVEAFAGRGELPHQPSTYVYSFHYFKLNETTGYVQNVPESHLTSL